MNHPANHMADQAQQLEAIIRAATCGPISDDDARTLCAGCGLRVNDVLPAQINPTRTQPDQNRS